MAAAAENQHTAPLAVKDRIVTVQHRSQGGDPPGRKHHRQEPILKAVVEEYVAEARRQHRPDAVVVERPHRWLAG